MMLKTAASALAALFSLNSSSHVFVKGHGYLESPRSRNFYAHVEGPGCTGSGCPPVEHCEHCLNTNTGVCGMFGDHNYETANWLDIYNEAMPWIPQDTYTEGQTINIRSYLDTHHGGHMEIRACKIIDESSCTHPDHFEGNELYFVKDNIYPGQNHYPMPKDENYPERGMYGGWREDQTQYFSFDFKLPAGIFGEKVLLQWRYITANSCNPPGYAEYFDADLEIPTKYWNFELSPCVPPYPNDGSRSATSPEQFWNCAEVEILPGGTIAPTISPKPTSSPTTASPIVSKAPINPQVIGGPTCKVEWSDCTDDWHNCCSGLICRQVDPAGWKTCLVDTCSDPSPPSPPSPSTPTPPYVGTGCCYDRNTGYQQCHSNDWCSESQDQCSACGGAILTSPLVQTGCCSYGSDCSDIDPQENPGCHYMQSDCEGDCNGSWMAFSL